MCDAQMHKKQLTQVLEEVNPKYKSLMQLDASLLERLTSNTGDLLEDEELVTVLANTKAKADEIRSNFQEEPTLCSEIYATEFESRDEAVLEQERDFIVQYHSAIITAVKLGIDTILRKWERKKLMVKSIDTDLSSNENSDNVLSNKCLTSL